MMQRRLSQEAAALDTVWEQALYGEAAMGQESLGDGSVDSAFDGSLFISPKHAAILFESKVCTPWGLAYAAGGRSVVLYNAACMCAGRGTWRCMLAVWPQ